MDLNVKWQLHMEMSLIRPITNGVQIYSLMLIVKEFFIFKCITVKTHEFNANKYKKYRSKYI